MPILITALIELSIYLAAVPVCAAFSLSTEGGLRLGVGFSAFERRVALRRARRGRPLRRPRSRTGPKRFFKALKRLRGADIRLQGRLGLGDAAATATACGALAALAAALGGQLGRVRVDVAPLFDEAVPRIDLQGMIRVPSGQIISAIALNGANDIQRRIAQWTDIRLKA